MNPNARPFVVAGSWEDRLKQAQRMIAQYDERAIPTLRTMIERLSGLAPAQLAAGDGRLFAVRLVAARLLEDFLLRRGELAQAIETRAAMIPWLLEMEDEEVEDDEVENELVQMLAMLTLARRYEEAEVVVEKLTELGSGLTNILANAILTAIYSGDGKHAERLLAELERAVNRQQDREAVRFERGRLAMCRARLSVLRKQWTEATAWFENACAFDPHQSGNAVIVYAPLVRNGEAQKALSLMARDEDHPLRVALWRGLALRSLGNEEAARQVWSEALASDLKNYSSNSGFFEWVLCHYYLVEPAAIGYAIILQVSGADGEISWFGNCLTGLGAALRGDRAGAFVHLNLALEKFRVDLRGLYLGEDIRYHFVNLLTPEQMAPLMKYFKGQ